MPPRRPSHVALIIRHPIKLFRSVYHASALLGVVLLHRLLFPFACRATGFGTEVRRCLLGGLLANFWDLLFKQPLGVQRDKHYTEVHLRRVPAVVVPRNALTAQEKAESTNGGDLPSRAPQPVVLLYAHGGGYLFGEPLMYLSAYERWIRGSKALGFDLIIVSVDYRLSDEAKWPACRNDFLTAYLSLVEDYGIDPEKVVFGGDSAGGGLVAMSAIHTRRDGLPRPGGMIMISPWLDLRMCETLDSPAMATDYLITFQKENPKLVHLLLPQGMTPENPLVSPVLDDLSSLPQQLVLAGTAEVLLPDSKEWSRKSKQAGNRIELVLERGQMHTYAMGWPYCSREIERKTDQAIARFLCEIH